MKCPPWLAVADFGCARERFAPGLAISKPCRALAIEVVHCDKKQRFIVVENAGVRGGTLVRHCQRVSFKVDPERFLISLVLNEASGAAFGVLNMGNPILFASRQANRFALCVERCR